MKKQLMTLSLALTAIGFMNAGSVQERTSQLASYQTKINEIENTLKEVNEKIGQLADTVAKLQQGAPTAKTTAAEMTKPATAKAITTPKASRKEPVAQTRAKKEMPEEIVEIDEEDWE